MPRRLIQNVEVFDIPVSVTMIDDIYDKIRLKAKIKGSSASAVVKEIIKDFLKRRSSMPDVIREFSEFHGVKGKQHRIYLPPKLLWKLNNFSNKYSVPRNLLTGAIVFHEYRRGGIE